MQIAQPQPDIYHIYNFVEKAFFVNFMYWRCKSGPKLG